MEKKSSNKIINISQDLSIFITTMNRYDFIKSLIDFYEKQKLTVPIYIADSSINTIHQKIKKDISKSDLNIKLFNFNKNTKQIDLFLDLVKKIETRLCIYSGDDDYILLDQLDLELKSKSITFFKNNILNLRAFAWILDKNKIPKTVSPVRSIPFVKENNDERLIEFASDYNSIMFSVVSKKSMLEALLFSSNFKTKEINAEVAICYKLAFRNKVQLTEQQCLIRLAHDNIISLSNVGDTQEDRQVDRFQSLLELLGFEKIKNLPIELIQPERNYLYDLDLVIKNTSSIENLVRSSEWLFEYFCKNFLFNYDKIYSCDVLFWGNKQTLRISSSWVISKLNSKNILVFFTFEDSEEEKKYLKENFKNKNFYFYDITEVASPNEVILFVLFKKMFKSVSVGTFLSISALYSTEQILIKLLKPEKTILVWPHASNLLNYPFILNLSKLKFINRKFVRILSLILDYRGMTKFIIFKTLLGFNQINIADKKKPELDLTRFIILINKISKFFKYKFDKKSRIKTILTKIKKLMLVLIASLIFSKHYVLRFLKYILFKILSIIIFVLILPLKLIKSFTILNDILIKVATKVLRNKRYFHNKLLNVPIIYGISIVIYNLINKIFSKRAKDFSKPQNQYSHDTIITLTKLNYPKFSVASQLWIYNKLVSRFDIFFFTLFPDMYREYFGYFLLPKIINIRIPYILGGDKFTQIGGTINDEIFCLSDNEAISLSKFSKSNMIKHEKIYKIQKNKIFKKNKNIAIMTLSVGLISENNNKLTSCLKEVIKISKELGISEIHLRPHYREIELNNERLIDLGNKFGNINFRLISNVLPFSDEVKKYYYHLSSISGSIFESEANTLKVILLKEFSKQQYSDINQFIEMYPQFKI